MGIHEDLRELHDRFETLGVPVPIVSLSRLLAIHGEHMNTPQDRGQALYEARRAARAYTASVESNVVQDRIVEQAVVIALNYIRPYVVIPHRLTWRERFRILVKGQ